MCERIELTTTVIKFWRTVEWAKFQEWFCVVFTIVLNNSHLHKCWNNNHMKETI